MKASVSTGGVRWAKALVKSPKKSSGPLETAASIFGAAGTACLLSKLSGIPAGPRKLGSRMSRFRGVPGAPARGRCLTKLWVSSPERRSPKGASSILGIPTLNRGVLLPAGRKRSQRHIVSSF